MTTQVKPPTWFWIAAVVALLWSVMGCLAYFMQMTISPEDFAKLPQAQQDVWSAMPIWVSSAYAIAVGASLVGSIAMLLRRAFARSAYVLSLVAVVIQFGWTFLATPILTTVGIGSIGFPALIALAGAAMIWFAVVSIRRGWIV